MSGAAQPTSIRLTDATLQLLDKTAESTRRSRSHIIEEALQAHLSAEDEGGRAAMRRRRVQALMEIAERGERASAGFSSAEIDQRSREFRGAD